MLVHPVGVLFNWVQAIETHINHISRISSVMVKKINSKDLACFPRRGAGSFKFKSRCLRKPGRFKRWGSAKFYNTMST